MKISFALFSALILAFSACTTTPVVDEPEETAEVVLASEEIEEGEMMMEMPDPLSTEDAQRFQAGLPLADRLELAGELTKLMPLDGMDLMLDMFPDLSLVEEITDEDDRNMLKMGAEGLYYSEEGDFTVQVCLMANSPMHLYTGTPSASDFEEAMQMMEEMMNEGDHMDM